MHGEGLELRGRSCPAPSFREQCAQRLDIGLRTLDPGLAFLYHLRAPLADWGSAPHLQLLEGHRIIGAPQRHRGLHLAAVEGEFIELAGGDDIAERQELVTARTMRSSSPSDGSAAGAGAGLGIATSGSALSEASFGSLAGFSAAAGFSGASAGAGLAVTGGLAMTGGSP